MNGVAVHFGSSGLPLFGTYEPAGGARRRTGVLLCPPLGWEYMRSHRTLRLLAARLVDLGFDVLRFDYRGTGDSAGDIEQVSDASELVSDVRAAHEELLGLSGNSRTVMLGLREGATFAAAAAAMAGPELTRLVLWDLPTWGHAQSGLRDDGEHPDSPLSPSPALQDSVIRLRASLRPSFPVPTVLVSSFGEDQVPAEWRAQAAGVAGGGDVPACWVEDRDFGAGAVPLRLLERVLEEGFSR